MSLDPDVFTFLCHAASMVSEPLQATFAQIGPIAIPGPTHARVADRLFVEVINQQLSTRAALAIWGRIESLAAERGLVPRDLFAPEEEAALRGCGVSGNKVRALLAIRDAEAAGLLDANLTRLPQAERSAVLCRIRGVGPWTADMIGIFHFRDPDIWPRGDVAAVGTLRRLSGRDDDVAVAAAFAPYRSILARYMWRARDLEPGSTPA
ncbi:DNA-3-methyladenine glycosylase family protein [Methylobacterium radiodurans]|uniref:DNA-3-methyladenine glycosylase II n=1 Tax=Methylobacterium radiodurans TaxID=2202828 RepID=A0A2U8VM00_9HYPH|nr:Fe-S cluster assembly protein HesB [Methylobacterium radiodurans]AWN34416.1 Fe-S cluster assembly protein HesB [Methylobacterium radiodurans]